MEIEMWSEKDLPTIVYNHKMSERENRTQWEYGVLNEPIPLIRVNLKSESLVQTKICYGSELRLVIKIMYASEFNMK